MALTPEDLAQIKELFAGQPAATPSAPAETPEQAAEREAREYRLKAGNPDVDPEAGPDYYVHLANGDVITTKDSGSTHMSVDGETVAVIGRYQVHPKTGEA